MFFLLSFFLLFGGFFYGMYLLRFGLLNLSTNTLKKWLINLTDTYWKGMLLGIFISLFFQNGTIVMVITVGLVAARILTFSQSIGIMLGINIGTTITIEIITIDIETYAVLMALIGAILCFMKNRHLNSMGYTLIGLSLVFGALWGFEMIAYPISDVEYVNDMVNNLEYNKLSSVLIGTVFSAIVQSMNTLSGIAAGLLLVGKIDLAAGTALMFGGNIGSCVTVLIAAIGSGKKGWLTAFALTWLNVLGVVLFYALIEVLVFIGTNLSDQPDIQLVHINIIFNIIVSLIVLPFSNQFGRVIRKVHSRKTNSLL